RSNGRAATNISTAQEKTMNIHWQDTAILFTDPQNEVLSEQGGAWKLVRDSIRENKTVEHMERIFQRARQTGFEVFISPHYYFPTDDRWQFRDPLGSVMHENHLFARTGALTLDGFSGSGADWLARFKPYIEDGKTVVVSPHKIYGPESNDLVLQLRKRGIGKVIVGGMLANMCVESHARELLEQGFDVAVVKDATAAPRHPVWGDGYAAALINFAYLAPVMTTDEVIDAMKRGQR
ncbi:MAG TPA: cysteine hydrolase, partial [Candidatus Acidoferrum sp.]|nr:cysteine hydrolase [Candidatus Acidoferrum sp.]